MLHEFSQQCAAQHVQVLGVSPDTVKTHQRFIQMKGITLLLISDTSGRIQRSYLPGRVTLLIDQHGMIRHMIKGYPSVASLRNALDTLLDVPVLPR